MAIIWRDELVIDGGVIDDDHKCLIGLVNEVDLIGPGPTMAVELATILAQLRTYARIHFEREERLQIATAFPYAQAHRAGHRDLARELDAMRTEFETTVPEQMGAFHGRLRDFLHHWLRDHIIGSDLLMKPFAAEMQRYSQATVALVEAVKLSEAYKSPEPPKPYRQLLLPAGKSHRRRERRHGAAAGTA